MQEQRQLIRLEVADFLEIRLLENQPPIKGRGRNISSMGICFSCQSEWTRGQVLLIDYFIPEDMDSVKLKVLVIWSEFIDPESGFFCGGEIIDIEDGKIDQFVAYYLQRLEDRFYK